MRLGALLAALGVLLERFKGRAIHRIFGESSGRDQGAAWGGIREGSSTQSERHMEPCPFHPAHPHHKKQRRQGHGQGSYSAASAWRRCPKVSRRPFDTRFASSGSKQTRRYLTADSEYTVSPRTSFGKIGFPGGRLWQRHREDSALIPRAKKVVTCKKEQILRSILKVLYVLGLSENQPLISMFSIRFEVYIKINTTSPPRRKKTNKPV